jgi:hypothetical protein
MKESLPRPHLAFQDAMHRGMDASVSDDASAKLPSFELTAHQCDCADPRPHTVKPR